MQENWLIDTDSYKSSHFLQYPPDAEGMFSYFESRGGEFDEVVFFGLQYYLKRYLSQKITLNDVIEAKKFFTEHGEPFNDGGFAGIVMEHGGYLPLRIRAVPEGTSVPVRNALFTVESTDPNFFWLVNYVETMLSRVWYSSTVATVSNETRKLIMRYLTETSDDPQAEINFKLHDFGSRGVSSQESAGIGGMAHLINFMGSDTVMGVRFANRYYNAGMAGFSIPAAEHSTITSWGKEHEVDAYRNMLFHFAKKGSIVAVVSDSYDLWNAIDNFWGGTLRDAVINSGATVVIRPDSGTPYRVVRDAAERLDAKFGHTINSKGFKVLNNVRIIQGDGIDLGRSDEHGEVWRILEYLKEGGYSASNVAFGSGGALLQKMNRDTCKFAYKCSSITRKGEYIDVYKDPVTDPGKRSKAGRLDLVKTEQGFATLPIPHDSSSYPNTAMRTVFQNGMVYDESFSDIRLRTMK